jgi:hypothetical protein
MTGSFGFHRGSWLDKCLVPKGVCLASKEVCLAPDMIEAGR